MRNSRRARWTFGLMMAAGLAFIYVPLGVIVINSFNASTVFAWPPRHLTTHWWTATVGNDSVRSAVLTSIEVGLVATAVALLLGTLLAFALGRYSFFGRHTLSLLVVLPIALPGIVTALAFRTGFRTFLGLELSIWTVATAHATFCIVVVYNNVLARLRRMGTTPEEASMDLGADTFTTFRLVTFPLLRGAMVAGALLAFGLIAWNERRKVLATRLAAREALQQANDELERRIAERTADLHASNQHLREQIRERRQAEDTLRKAQDRLVQAGKLAVIGQMSTSIAHELNQPLAALRTLSGNTVRFLQRGALDIASSNLEAINEMVDRMGRITASLRAFARRADDHGQARLGKAVDAALRVLQVRLKDCPLALHREFDDVCLGIDQTRLEQILVNLIANALDAMSAQADRQLWLSGRAEGAQYHLTVRDNGPGIPPDAREHLFEPFFTTKPGEHGLGLGLTLSASLATAAGGSLGVAHPEAGGTAFELSLPLLPTQEPTP